MDFLIDLDRQLFATINGQWTNSVFDVIMPAITDLHKEPIFHVFAIVLLGIWIIRKRVQALKWILALIVAVGLADAISYRVIKVNVERDRPQDAGIEVVLRTHQHSGKSFPSNHAANIFAAGTVLSGAFPPFAPLFYGVAATVAYSRVYVGVHFPLDVLAGALIGILLGLIARHFTKKWVGLIEQPTRSKY